MYVLSSTPFCSNLLTNASTWKQGTERFLLKEMQNEDDNGLQESVDDIIHIFKTAGWDKTGQEFDNKDSPLLPSLTISSTPANDLTLGPYFEFPNLMSWWLIGFKFALKERSFGGD